MVRRKRSMFAGLCVVLAAVAASQTAFANSGTAKGVGSLQAAPVDRNVPAVVALGDSITFGLYLPSISAVTPSSDAYPTLLANDENLPVRNLGIPGWTSEALLSALKSSTRMQQSLKSARVVTIDIGSNDLLSLASADGLLSSPHPSVTPAEEQQLVSAITQFSETLPLIISQVKALSPHPYMVIYNLYNPIPSSAPQLFAFGEQLIGAENAIIARDAHEFQIPLANAHTAFMGHNDSYLIPGNVHPNVRGQRILALLGERALNNEGFQAGDWGEGQVWRSVHWW